MPVLSRGAHCNGPGARLLLPAPRRPNRRPLNPGRMNDETRWLSRLHTRDRGRRPFAPAAHAEVDTILNVSYDIARELFAAINEQFSADCKAEHRPRRSRSTSPMPARRSRRAPISKASRRTSSPSTRSPTPDPRQQRAWSPPTGRSSSRTMPRPSTRCRPSSSARATRRTSRTGAISPRRREGDLPEPEDLGQCALHLSRRPAWAQEEFNGDEAKVTEFVTEALRQCAGVRHRRPRARPPPLSSARSATC